MNGKAPRCAVLVCDVFPEMEQTYKVSMAVSETNDMSHDVFFPCCTEVRVFHE